MTIRRPLYYAAVAMAAAILIKQYFGLIAAVGTGAALAAFVMIHRQSDAGREIPGTGETRCDAPCRHGEQAGEDHRCSRGNLQTVLTLVAVMYLLSVGSMVFRDARMEADPAPGYIDESVKIVGIVKEPSLYRDSRDREMMRIDTQLLSINGKEVRGSRILVNVPAEDITDAAGTSAMMCVPPGTLLRCSGKLRAPQQRRNPNCFDYRTYLKSCGIQAVLRAETADIAGASGRMRIAGSLFRIRESYLARIEAHAGPGTEALLRAILFGSRSQLDEDLQDVFQNNGTAHILAVSGLHVGMLYAAMTSLWNLLLNIFPGIFGLRKGRRFFLCTALFFIAYMFMAGFAPSVVRAVCMVLLHAFAQMTGRRYDLSSAAFAVGILALLHQPYILLQTGFQMSFLAILTLGLIAPYIHQVYSGVFVGSIAVQIGLGPYMVCQFNVLSLIAVLINVPVIFLAGILVPAGMAGMILPVGLEMYDRGLAGLCTVMVRLNEICFVDQVTARTAASPPLWIVSFYYLCLLVFASEEGRRLFLRKKRSVITKLAAAILAVSLLFGTAADDGFRQLDLVFVDVGQGDCIHVRSCGRNYLIDGGGSNDYSVGEKTLKPYLLKNGVGRIDAAFVTHLHTDHYRGVCELAKAGMIRRLFVYEGNRIRIEQICEDTGLPREAVSYLHSGQRVTLGKDAAGGRDTLEVLWPERKSDFDYRRMAENEEDENASSLIMRITVRGVSLLATGDLGEEGESVILRKYAGKLHTDILKVGHHGSKTSSSDQFLDAVRPAFAVIQVGERNMYGHPAPETLERLADRGIPICRNDLQGAVGIKIDRGRLKEVKTMINNSKAAVR